MSQQTVTTEKCYLASLALVDAYTDFILSRQAMQCANNMMIFYRYIPWGFLSWAEGKGVTTPEQVDARLIRYFLAEMTSQGKSDATLNAYARAIRTLLRFWYAEKYIPAPVSITMPKMAKKRLPVLSADELKQVLSDCTNPRNKALVFSWQLQVCTVLK